MTDRPWSLDALVELCRTGKDKLRLTSIQVRLTAPLLLPGQLRQGLRYDWSQPTRDEVVRRLTADDVQVEVETEFTDTPENQNLIVRHAGGGGAVIRVFEGIVRSVAAFGG